MFWGCWSDQHKQIYQTFSMQSIAMFLSYTRFWGPNFNEGQSQWHLKVEICLGLGEQKARSGETTPATIPSQLLLLVSVVCTTQLSIPKCQSNTHQPTNPMNPTLISRHLSRGTQSKSKSTNPNAIYLLSWHASDFGNISPLWILLDVSANLVSENFANFSHRLELFCSSSTSNLL